MKPVHKKDLARVLRNLERKGLIESRLCSDGKVRWFVTEKGERMDAEDVEIPDERLN
jgi:hypothetical protein